MPNYRDVDNGYLRRQDRRRFASQNDDRMAMTWLIAMAALIVVGGYLILAQSTGIDQQMIDELAASAPSGESTARATPTLPSEAPGGGAAAPVAASSIGLPPRESVE